MKRTRLTHVKGATVEREFVHCDQCDRELGMYELGQAPSEPHLCNTKICKMKTETPPTIAELWKEFIGLDKVNSHYMSHPQFATARIDRHASLRQQLVERCKNDHGLSIEDRGDVLRIVRDRLHFVTVCGSYHARNEGSAWLFMGWDLQQREKEAQDEKA